MQQHLIKLINLLQKNDLKALVQHYLNSSEAENTAQLDFMFKQAEIKTSNFNYYQPLATSLVEAKGLSTSLIAKIKTNSALSFFTPALQLADNFKKADHDQCNVLHYLFTNDKIISVSAQPPFNYLRSMMLFGSNNTLCEALSHRDHQNLSPIEAYLLTNRNLTPLADHELTALLALIEIENKFQDIEQRNYSSFIQSLSQLCRKQPQQLSPESQRIILIATYYKTPIQKVLSDINPMA